jgi:hypothetical protein
VFEIIQVDPDSLVGDEQLGSKSKFWFEMNGHRWLFKMARENTGEDWAEKIAAEIAGSAHVQAAYVELAQYRGHRGSATLSFVDNNESLVHGNEILAGQIFGYDRQKRLKQSDHTFDNIVAAVEKLVGGAEWYHDMLKELARYIVLDALICNTDRHHENWGFLTRIVSNADGGIMTSLRIAPSFDHASSLGRELLPERAERILGADGVKAYARRGHGGVYWKQSDRRGANPLELVELAFKKFPDYLREALRDVARMPIHVLLDIVDEVPNVIMPEPARRFAKALLIYTHGVLSNLVQ